MTTAERFITLAQLARYCGVTEKTMSKWVTKEGVEHFRTPGGHRRFLRSVVSTFLEKHNIPKPKDIP